jgi:hypothetical protein
MANPTPMDFKVRQATAVQLLSENPLWSIARIAKAAGVSKSTVRKARERQGYPAKQLSNSITPVLRAGIAELLTFRPELPDTRIARAAGCSISTVGKIRKSLGLKNPSPRDRLTPEKKRRIIELLNSNPTPSDISVAELVGCSSPTVSNIRHSIGIKAKHGAVAVAPEIKQQIASLLVENPKISGVQIAQSTGVAKSTANRIKKELIASAQPRNSRLGRLKKSTKEGTMNSLRKTHRKDNSLCT